MKFFKDRHNSHKMDRKIYLVFILVVIIGISNAIISAITIRNSKKIVYDISMVVNPTLEKIEEFNLVVTKSRMLITNWVYLSSSQTDKDSLLALNNREYPQLKGSLQKLMKSWKSTEDVDKMNRLFYAYEQLKVNEEKITSNLNRFDDYLDPMKKFAAEEEIENEIIPRSNAIMLQLKELTSAKKMEASALQNRMIDSYYYLFVMVLGLAVLIIASVLMAGGYMLKKVIVPIMKIREVIMQMSKGELPDFNLKLSYNALGEMSYAIRQLIDGLKRTANFAGEIGEGNLTTPFTPLSKNDVFGSALLEMRKQLANASTSAATRNWINQGVASLGGILHKNIDDIDQLTEEVIYGLTTYIEAQQGAIYLLNDQKGEEKFIEISGFYGLNNTKLRQQRLSIKQGLVGQCISLNKRILVPSIANPEYYIETGLTKSSSCHVLLVPLYANGQVLGAIEIVSVSELSETKVDFVTQFAEPVSANIFSLRANLFTKRLLEESQKLAAELATQDEELRQINNELTTQSQLLKLSEEELKKQQEELKIANSELETRAVLLEEKNLTIEDARQSIVFKAEQLEKSNKYKSAFLANMSHELRTPLNSVLILARLLADNRDLNLNDKQMEYARVIHKSGSDLLLLINDILDLSKIESGNIELSLEEVSPKLIVSDLYNLFKELANEKGIHFQVNQGKTIPEQMITDRMRLDQILKNLLSNAFKFTPKDGTVTIDIDVAKENLTLNNAGLFAAEKIITIAVTDTGIGIPIEKQQLVFEAFKQADGSTSRKYGGTGLGLAISKELANLLGGDLVLSSKEGEGSVFTLILPDKLFSDQYHTSVEETSQLTGISHSENKNMITLNEIGQPQIFDDRKNLNAEDPRILIIEDDLVFCKTIIDLAHFHKLKVIAVSQGDSGLKAAYDFFPNAILLDMQLPVTDGWTVLKKLKEDPSLKHIPVYILSGMEKQKLGMEMGAAGYLLKPIKIEDLDKILLTIKSGSLKRIMLVENRSKEMELILNRLREKEKNSSLIAVENMQDCIVNMQKEKFNSILLNASLAAIPEYKQLIEIIEKESHKCGTHLCLYDENEPGDSLTFPDMSVISENQNAAKKGQPLAENDPVLTIEFNRPAPVLPDIPGLLKDKKVLLADDDMRNVYALTNMLENEGVQVICAYDGKDALQKLNENPEIELVLMDIMMPEMDGYEATRQIRKNEKWAKLPVIALTGKAMTGDREKCLQAGASDYLSKPVNIDQLISIMKVWLYQ